jgi:hypothetical protein
MDRAECIGQLLLSRGWHINVEESTVRELEALQTPEEIGSPFLYKHTNQSASVALRQRL